MHRLNWTKFEDECSGLDEYQTSYTRDGKYVYVALFQRKKSAHNEWALYVELGSDPKGHQSHRVFCGMDRLSTNDPAAPLDWAQASVAGILTTFANDITNLAGKIAR